MSSTSRCGYVAIMGRPNVGKSTLLNGLLHKKISIISPKPQTTRHQIMGIKTVNDTQIIFIDTPGIHETEARAMNRYLNRLAAAVIPDADMILFMIEAMGWKKEDELVLETLKFTPHKAPVILVINKVDQLRDKKQLLPLMEQCSTKYNFLHIIPISAIDANRIAELEKEIVSLLPQGPHLFPDDQYTDKDVQFQVGELIREKIIQTTEQELPYSTAVQIDSFDREEKLIKINAIIWVERDGQKAIIIGSGGERLKKIGTLARKEIEKLLGNKVFLRLWVKVKDRWTDDDRAISNFGYKGN